MSSQTYRIEPWNESHAEGVMAIFNHYIEHDFSAYFDEARPVAFFGKMMEMAEGYPAFVALDEAGEVVGFALLGAYHHAPAFKETAMITYFIDPAHTGKGIGKLMLNELVAQTKEKGIRNIIASISSLNEGSQAFHAKNGFSECGRLADIGRKFGRSFDVVYMQLKIGQD